MVNGVEVGGGSIRIHKRELQEHIFQHVLKVPCEGFSHLLDNFEHGCPPHGGIALGIVPFYVGVEELGQEAIQDSTKIDAYYRVIALGMYILAC